MSTFAPFTKIIDPLDPSILVSTEYGLEGVMEKDQLLGRYRDFDRRFKNNNNIERIENVIKSTYTAKLSFLEEGAEERYTCTKICSGGNPVYLSSFHGHAPDIVEIDGVIFHRGEYFNYNNSQFDLTLICKEERWSDPKEALDYTFNIDDKLKEVLTNPSVDFDFSYSSGVGNILVYDPTSEKFHLGDLNTGTNNSFLQRELSGLQNATYGMSGSGVWSNEGKLIAVLNYSQRWDGVGKKVYATDLKLFLDKPKCTKPSNSVNFGIQDTPLCDNLKKYVTDKGAYAVINFDDLKKFIVGSCGDDVNMKCLLRYYNEIRTNLYHILQITNESGNRLDLFVHRNKLGVTFHCTSTTSDESFKTTNPEASKVYMPAIEKLFNMVDRCHNKLIVKGITVYNGQPSSRGKLCTKKFEDDHISTNAGTAFTKSMNRFLNNISISTILESSVEDVFFEEQVEKRTEEFKLVYAEAEEMAREKEMIVEGVNFYSSKQYPMMCMIKKEMKDDQGINLYSRRQWRKKTQILQDMEIPLKRNMLMSCMNKTTGYLLYGVVRDMDGKFYVHHVDGTAGILEGLDGVSSKAVVKMAKVGYGRVDLHDNFLEFEIDIKEL